MNPYESNLKVFVSQLPPEWDESRLRDFFETHGALTEVSIFRHEGNSDCDLGLGCAYLTFARKSEAEDTIHKLTSLPVSTYL